MKAWTDCLKIVAIGAAVAALPVLLSASASAARPREHASHASSGSAAAPVMRVAYGHKMPAMDFGASRLSPRHGGAAMLHSAMFMSYKHGFSKTGKARYAMRGGYSYGYGGLQCVPFARAASGIELKGNAALWWDAAAGVYQRGSRPEPGSVLNFRATGHMRLGHVAVVAAVINSREIEVDHANWAGSYGGVSRGVAVQDVSEANDWSEVRVAMGHNGEFGSVYPTYGFIYDRPDSGGTMMATDTPRRMTPIQVNDEVAEAPAHPRMPHVYRPSRSFR